MNAAGLALLCKFETCSLKAYPDVKGYACGWGTHGADVDASTVWDVPTANARRDAFVGTVEAAIARIVHPPVPLNDNQHSALAVWGYNCWPGEWIGGETLAALNRGDYEIFGALLLTWDHVDGVENAQLKQRRKEELALFNTPC